MADQAGIEDHVAALLRHASPNALRHSTLARDLVPPIGPAEAPANAIPVVRGVGGTPIAYVIAASATVDVGGRVHDFTDGTIWLVGTQLDPSLPADAFVGLAYSTATLVVPRRPPGPPGPPGPPFPSAAPGATSLGTPIVVPDDLTAALTVHPGSTPAPSGSIDDDGARAATAPPAEVAFAVAPDGVQLTILGDASATLYGTTIAFTGGTSGAHAGDASVEWVIDYATVSGAPIDCSAPHSTVFVTSGSAASSSGDWRLPIVRTTADQLGTAIEGTFHLIGGAGVAAAWGRHPSSTPLTEVHIAVRHGWLQLAAAATGSRPLVDTYQLWDTGPPDHPRLTTLTVHGPSSGLVVSTQSADADVVEVTGCSVAARLDRPCLADGSQPRLDHLRGEYILGLTASGPAFLVLVSGTPPAALTESYLLDNAVLKTSGLAELLVVGQVSGSTADQGTMLFSATLSQLTPTLPDPYAANIVQVTQEPRQLRAKISWANAITLTFNLAPGVSQQEAGRLVGATNDQRLTTLYDVSSAIDQLGVTMLPQTLGTAQVDGQSLTVSGQSSALFALPGIAWEATTAADALGNRFVFPAFAADDGPSINVGVPTQALRPMTPDAFIAQYLGDYAAGHDLFAHVTLPFGLEAEVVTATTTPPSPAPRPLLDVESPDFGTVTGGRQLAIRAPSNPYLRPVLPGRSLTTGQAADVGYPPVILDPSIATAWNKQFSTGTPGLVPVAPIARIGLSGYGTSMFDDYVDPTIGVGISEARFDVIVGRTSYTLVQLRSMLCPWGVQVVNTTIFERDGAGWVQRRNTGWRAQSPGRFRFDGGALPSELGGVEAVVNVRNIVDPRLPHVTLGLDEWVQVSFDADIVLATDPNGLRVVGGDIGGGRVAGRAFTGWIDLTPSPTPPSMSEVLALMDAVHAADGSITATVAVGVVGTGAAATPGIVLALSGVDVTATSLANPARTLAVALRGIPQLPRDGSWSVARRTLPQTTPRPVDALTPVPLVRFSGDLVTWHLAEPVDVLNLATPATRYAIVQSTGTQQLVLEHPTISGVAGQNPLTFTQQPVLADVGALLGGGGLLPDLAGLLNFPSTFTGLNPEGDGLATTQTLTTATDLSDTLLIPLGPISVLLATNHDSSLPPSAGTMPDQSVLSVDINPTGSPRWTITITNVAFKLAIDGMGGSTDPVVAVVGDLIAADGRAPTLANLQFGYGTALGTVKEILSGIEILAKALPGGGADGLQVSFAGTKLRVRDGVSLPQLPLGLGYIEGISLDLGFDVDIIAKTMTFLVGLGTDQDPFTWLASPLAGNGLLQLGAGDAGLGVRMQAGIGVGLGIDVAIASGSASVCLAVALDTTQNPFGIMVLLTGSASVDVLDGLASASLTLTAGLGVAPHPGTLPLPAPSLDAFKAFLADTWVTFSAEVAVAIHLTVGWFVHVDWSGSWGFSETVSGAALSSLVP